MDREIEYLTDFEFQVKSIVAGYINGLHRSPYHGFSLEFAEHRPYIEGDSLRFLDWKQFARSGKRLTKRYEDDTNLRCHFIIDASASMYYPNNFSKLKTAALTIGSIVELLRNQRDAFGLSILKDSAQHLFSEKSTQTHQHTLFETLVQLLNVKPQAFSSPEPTLHYIAERLKKRAMVVLCTDGFFTESSFTAFEQSLLHLRHNQHEVIVFQILDTDTEIDLKFDNQMYRFVDLEQGNEIKLNPIHIQQNYKQSIRDFLKRWQTLCQKYKIDYLQLPAGGSYHEALRFFIEQRNRAKKRL